MADIYLLAIREAAKMPREICETRFPLRYARAQRMRFVDERLRRIGGGILLSSVLDVSESEIFSSEFGKPYANSLAKKFNLSHSGDYTALAVADHEVGADIEKINTARLDVARRFMTPEEQEWISPNPAERFFTIWTLKESATKQIGKGFHLPFSSFSVLPLVSGETITLDGAPVSGYSGSIEGHIFSVCTETKENIAVHRVTCTENGDVKIITI